MRHSITRRFRRKVTYQPAPRGVLPQRNERGIITHANPANPEVDIIFVHGLDGGSFTSWARNEDPRLYWPKEWLPKEMELTRARIHTYGYNLDPRRDLYSYWDFAGQFLTELVCSPMWFGTLPIILVGHSTGGLIIKRAYVMSLLSNLYSRISTAIQSFIFLSTPHKAPAIPSYKKWRKTNPCLISKPSLDATFSLIADQFSRTDAAYHKRIVSFVESSSSSITSSSLKRGAKMKKTLICGADTGVMGFEGEIVVPLHASHNGIAKFKGPNNVGYATFYRHLAAVVAEIRAANEIAPLIPPPAYTQQWEGQTNTLERVCYVPHEEVRRNTW